MPYKTKGMNIYHLLSNKVWGEPEYYVLDLACRQRADGNYVEIVTRRQKSIIHPFHSNEFPISTLPFNGVTDIDSAIRLGRMIKKRKNVVIHAHTLKDAITACYARKFSENRDVKVIVTRHIIEKGKSGMIYKTLYRDIDKLIFVSDDASERFLSGNPKIAKQKLEIAQPSVHVHRITKQADIHKEFSVPEDRTIFVCTGRISKDKNLETLISAASKLPRDKFFLLIIGDGKESYVKQIEALIVSNQLVNNVKVLDFKTNYQDYMLGCDAGMVSTETCGLRALEYMMFGKPVITTNNTAHSNIIDNGVNGLLVNLKDIDGLAAAMDEIISNREKAKEMGEAGKKRFEDLHDYTIFYNKISAIYNSLTSQDS